MSTGNNETPSGRSSSSGGQQSSALGQTLYQKESLLFSKPPQEIRDMIYDQVFADTHLTFRRRHPFRWHDISQTNPHALALLQTCRRAKEEIGHRWLRQVLFLFQHPMMMLDKLSMLPHHIISQIRHVNVRAGHLFLNLPEDRYGDGRRQFLPWANTNTTECQVSLVSALKLIPGLRLDILTVRFPDEGLGKARAVRNLDWFLGDSDGWKELRFIFSTCIPINERDHWQSILDLRDGADSRPSVAIYYLPAEEGGHFDSVGTDSLIADSSMWWQRIGHDNNGTNGDASSISTTMHVVSLRKFMVVGRRGKGVAYEEKSNSPYIRGDIRQLGADLDCWKTIRANPHVGVR